MPKRLDRITILKRLSFVSTQSTSYFANCSSADNANVLAMNGDSVSTELIRSSATSRTRLLSASVSSSAAMARRRERQGENSDNFSRPLAHGSASSRVSLHVRPTQRRISRRRAVPAWRISDFVLNSPHAPVISLTPFREFIKKRRRWRETRPRRSRAPCPLRSLRALFRPRARVGPTLLQPLREGR